MDGSDLDPRIYFLRGNALRNLPPAPKALGRVGTDPYRSVAARKFLAIQVVFLQERVAKNKSRSARNGSRILALRRFLDHFQRVLDWIYRTRYVAIGKSLF